MNARPTRCIMRHSFRFLALSIVLSGSSACSLALDDSAGAEGAAAHAAGVAQPSAGDSNDGRSGLRFLDEGNVWTSRHPTLGRISVRGGEVVVGESNNRVTFVSEFAGATPAEGRRVSAAPNQVTIDVGRGVVERWVGHGDQLEQHFYIPEPLAADASIDIEVRLRGASAVSYQRGAVLQTALGTLAYRDLAAFANDGTRLQSEMRVRGDRIELHVVAHPNEFPVTIDPTVSYDPITSVLLPTSARGSNFGASTTVSGTRAAVGAPLFSGVASSTNSIGTVHTYTYNTMTAQWVLESTIAPGLLAGDRAGACVALSGTTLAIGIPGATGNTGRVAIYTFTMALGWSLQGSITAATPVAGDTFGEACSMLGDTLIVGAPGRMSGHGATFVFARSGGVWTQEAELAPGDLGTGDAFGNSVSLDAIGADSFLIAGAPKNDTGGANAGAAYVFSRASGTTVWTQAAKLQRAMPAASDEFGAVVAISGPNVVVSARTPAKSVFFQRTPIVFMGSTIYTWPALSEFSNAGGGCAISGSLALVGNRFGIYVSAYTLSGTVWTRQPVDILPASASMGASSFGASIALSGLRAIMGNPSGDYANAPAGGAFDAVNFVVSPYSATQLGTTVNPDAVMSGRAGAAVATDGLSVAFGEPGAEVRTGAPPATAVDQGRAYVYSVNTSFVVATYSLQAQLTRGSAGDRFGAAVAVRGDTLAIGAPGAGGAGAVHIYLWNGSAWTFATTLTPAVPESGSDFGASLSYHGGTLLVGSPLRDAAGADAGAVFVFVGSGSSWSQQTMLIEPGAAAMNHFGSSAAMGTNTAIVGVPDRGSSDDGAAVVFVRTGASWNSGTTLTATGGAAGDHFGASVAVAALSDGAYAVGAPNRTEAGLAGNGAAFVFTPSGASFVEQKILPTTMQAQGRFGQSVAITGLELVVGQPGRDVSPTAGRGSIEIRVAQGSFAAGWGAAGTFHSLDSVRTNQDFGAALAAAPGIVIVGAPKNAYVSTIDGGEAQAVSYANNLGEPCDAAAPACGAASSGYACADGVCCGSTCFGGVTTDCVACSVAAGASSNGTCGPVLAAAALTCRPSSGVCDVAEVCNGVLSTCPADAFAANDVPCSASAGACDSIEYCTGSSAACPLDVLAPSGQLCRVSSGICDSPEFCNGTTAACPADAVSAAGTLCRAAVAGGCDVAESCDGASSSCPSDTFAPAGALCRPSSGMVCDVAETCSGSSAACPADTFAAAGTLCRSASGMCDPAESCSGAGPACPADVFGCCTTNGDCTDADVCTSDACVAGVCMTTPVAGCCNVDAECEDGNVCTAGTCASHSCTQAPVAGCCTVDAECDDSDLCTADTCAGNACSHAMVAGCPMDAGVPVDASLPADAGTASDGGSAFDSSIPTDASSADGSSADGSVASDAAAMHDGAFMIDAAPQDQDASLQDAAAIDSSVADSGAPRDAQLIDATHGDAAQSDSAVMPPEPTPPSGGCCSVAAGAQSDAENGRSPMYPLLLGAALLGLIALRRRR